MITLAALIVPMLIVVVLGKQRWRKRSTIYVIAALIALLQTLLVLYEMFSMKMPLNL